MTTGTLHFVPVGATNIRSRLQVDALRQVTAYGVTDQLRCCVPLKRLSESLPTQSTQVVIYVADSSTTSTRASASTIDTVAVDTAFADHRPRQHTGYIDLDTQAPKCRPVTTHRYTLYQL